MPAHDPDDVVDSRGFSEVVGHFVVPTIFVTRQPVLKATSERYGIETLRSCFTFE